MPKGVLIFNLDMQAGLLCGFHTYMKRHATKQLLCHPKENRSKSLYDSLKTETVLN